MGEKIKLDKLDMKILYALDCDATQPFAKIGKRLKVGRDVITYRVKRLEEQGVIEKYIYVIDFSKVGHIVAALYIKLHHVSPQLRKEILEYYKGREDIWWLFDMTPEYDLAFGWFGKDVVDVRKKEIEILSKYRSHFRNFKFRIYSQFFQFRRNYLLPAHQAPLPPVVVDAKPKKLTDETDEHILQSLAGNARKTYVQIAKEFSLSPAQVHYRISALRKNGVLLFARPKLDLEKIGFEYFKLDIYLDDFSKYEKLKKFLFAIPNVIYAFDVIGGADIELDIHARSFDDFMEIQDSIKAAFSDAISHTEYYQFKKEYKQVYF